MSAGLPDRPSLADRIGNHRERYARDSHQAPVGPKPPGKRSTVVTGIKPHSREGHVWRHQLRAPAVQFALQRKAAKKKAERERILYGSKPTLEQRLAALPPPTHTPIAPKPVLLSFDRLTPDDLVQIFTPKFAATLKRLEVFADLDIDERVPHDHEQDLRHLINSLTHISQRLSQASGTTTHQEWQSWNFGLKQIGEISFKGLRGNQACIIKALVSVWRSNYFESF